MYGHVVKFISMEKDKKRTEPCVFSSTKRPAQDHDLLTQGEDALLMA